MYLVISVLLSWTEHIGPGFGYSKYARLFKLILGMWSFRHARDA
jgi:hypothetical protein